MYYSLSNSKFLEKILKGLEEPSCQTIIKQKDSNHFQKTTERGVEFEMFVPGLTKNDITIELEGCEISIHAKYESDLTSYEISKSFTIGDTIDSKNISASVENGVLKITFPYIKQEEKQKNKIQIF